MGTRAEERYCVDSGRPVRLIPGDRCLSHGAEATPCFTALRAPRCKHPRQSPNHPYPHCTECGSNEAPINATGRDGGAA